MELINVIVFWADVIMAIIAVVVTGQHEINAWFGYMGYVKDNKPMRVISLGKFAAVTAVLMALFVMPVYAIAMAVESYWLLSVSILMLSAVVRLGMFRMVGLDRKAFSSKGQ